MQSQEKDLSLVNNLLLNSDEIEAFRRQGFIKLKGFLSEHAIQSLKQAARSKVISAQESKSAYGDSFSRFDLRSGDNRCGEKHLFLNRVQDGLGDVNRASADHDRVPEFRAYPA